MSDWNIQQAVDVLLAAERDRTELARITEEWPELNLEVAYQVQDALIARKVANGERIVGIKLGLTSRAKQQRMGIDSPLIAWLTDAMVLTTGQAASTATMIHPRAEPEIVFIMKDCLSGPGVSVSTAMQAVGSVHAGIEIIDSRFRDYSFALPDVVADNASSSAFAVGSSAVSPDGLDLELEACLFSVDGEVVDSATGAAVQGHPAEALALAANALSQRGIAIEAGWIVLTGGMTDAVPLTPGQVISAEFTNLGTVAFSVA